MLGDGPAQQQIRDDHPGEHCTLLMRSPTACSGCPKNPRRRDPIQKADAGLIDSWSRWLTEMYELAVLKRTGVVLRECDVSWVRAQAMFTFVAGAEEHERTLATQRNKQKSAQLHNRRPGRGRTG